MRRLNLAKIREEQRVTQQRLAELTDYPQGFISQIERGKANAPTAFIQKLQEVFGIDEIEPYLMAEVEESAQAEDSTLSESAIGKVDELKAEGMAARFIKLLEHKDEQIRFLQDMIVHLQQRIAALEAASKSSN